jgi:predicted MFS family arabinose efflux permease
VNAVLAPDLVRDLDISASELGLLTSAFFISMVFLQLPLGMVLDRYGPRRTSVLLMTLAVAGAALFALADSAPGLFAGRALIGIGMATGGMAAMTAFVKWFPPDRLPLIINGMAASGALGVLTATVPVEAALAYTDWRGIYMGLAVLSLLILLAVQFVAPERPTETGHSTLREQLSGLGRVLRDPYMMRIMPAFMVIQGGFTGIQALWAGPWLRDIAGLGRDGVAGVLMVIAGAQMIGLLSSGYLATWFGRRGVPPTRVMFTGIAIFFGVELLLFAQWTGAVAPLWAMFGLFGPSTVLLYGIMSQRFPRAYGGRVNTTINFMMFSGIIGVQWGFGVVIDQFPTGTGGTYDARGYAAGFALLITLQVCALIWFMIGGFIWRDSR